jgi:hypothetical protein
MTIDERLDKLERRLGNLEFKIIEGKSYKYLFVRQGGSYFAFAAKPAKVAARDCGADESNTRHMCKRVWEGR